MQSYLKLVLLRNCKKLWCMFASW